MRNTSSVTYVMSFCLTLQLLTDGTTAVNGFLTSVSASAVGLAGPPRSSVVDESTQQLRRHSLQQCTRLRSAARSLGIRWATYCNQSVASESESRDVACSVANVRSTSLRSRTISHSAGDCQLLQCDSMSIVCSGGSRKKYWGLGGWPLIVWEATTAKRNYYRLEPIKNWGWAKFGGLCPSPSHSLKQPLIACYMQSAVLAVVNTSVRLSVRPYFTGWHCVKTTHATIMRSSQVP